MSWSLCTILESWPQNTHPVQFLSSQQNLHTHWERPGVPTAALENIDRDITDNIKIHISFTSNLSWPDSRLIMSWHQSYRRPDRSMQLQSGSDGLKEVVISLRPQAAASASHWLSLSAGTNTINILPSTRTSCSLTARLFSPCSVRDLPTLGWEGPALLWAP